MNGTEFHYHYNSKIDKIFDFTKTGYNYWLVSSYPLSGSTGHRILGRLTVLRKQIIQSPDEWTEVYGSYRVYGDPDTSDYFDPEQPDCTQLLLDLRYSQFKPLSPRVPTKICQAMQPIRNLSKEDNDRLTAWADRLRIIS